jgi:hypothetical protein
MLAHLNSHLKLATFHKGTPSTRGTRFNPDFPVRFISKITFQAIHDPGSADAPR